MEKQAFIIDSKTSISIPENASAAVQHGVRMFSDDMERVFQSRPAVVSAEEADIIIALQDETAAAPLHEEGFALKFKEKGNKRIMQITGADELGVIYGLLYISRTYLGIDPFWYWADLEITQLQKVNIPSREYYSEPAAVKYRGWFVNDEVCLIGWDPQYPPTRETWIVVFETLLRCGGNMVIPGTDLPKKGVHQTTAAEMGLWVSHHHAEPLGAQMFLRAYPDKKPSYQEHPELFEKLWTEAIKKQQHDKVLWVLSFRGQGDKPFWDDDPSYDTPQKRGGMISKVVRRQYDLINQYVDNPVCCLALYGEISELYQQGVLDLPENVIKVWADNGYGKMVSRRHGNINERIPSLPAKEDQGKHGIYYHVTFHDLQASNHLTMFPSTIEFMKGELEQVLERRADDYWLINSGNIRMHLYHLDFIAEMWQKGGISPEKHLRRFVQRMFSAQQQEIESLYRAYPQHSISYGAKEDEKAGEEYYHHPARLITAHMVQGKGEQAEEKLYWLAEESSFTAQVQQYADSCREGNHRWKKFREKAETVMKALPAGEQQRFYDLFYLQLVLHDSGSAGAALLAEIWKAVRQEDYPLAFVFANKAMYIYQEGQLALKQSEHGKWLDFYRADWLTNIKATIYSLDVLRKYLRTFGDSPDYFLWYKEFLMEESEKHIYLENTQREPLSDSTLAERLEAVFKKQGRLART
ncbi:glycosyl hydrolase 115 family protein [Alkalicoccus daliensis]|uniref:Glycosyl hydrolase family 115 n=1 Tax=Alkalicoccus daliensis TaxID=745820 RepID=A0A1H0EPZ1_9BACI|nr:glycosyl hydrolase 115 family protein [Alkalicoccus daliensis]SDN84442.1 Glycosyl hydrolase family 115 [Alkalicoccus daliensis]